jgi:DNA-binding transcriptional regulator YiaG
MDRQQQAALEAAGWRIGDAADFLKLTEDEARLVELKVLVGRAIRQRREQQHLTQHELAQRLRSSQSRVAKMEAAGSGVSLDLMFRGLFALGGSLADLSSKQAKSRATRRAASTKK